MLPIHELLNTDNHLQIYQVKFSVLTPLNVIQWIILKIQAYLWDVLGSGPDHCTKANIAIQWVIFFFFWWWRDLPSRCNKRTSVNCSEAHGAMEQGLPTVCPLWRRRGQSGKERFNKQATWKTCEPPKRNLSAEMYSPWLTEGPNFINSKFSGHLLVGALDTLYIRGRAPDWPHSAVKMFQIHYNLRDHISLCGLSDWNVDTQEMTVICPFMKSTNSWLGEKN